MSFHYALRNRLMDAMHAHRREKLASGQPFLLGTGGLPDDQAYCEYPDGLIAVVTRTTFLAHHEVIRFLSNEEARAVRAYFDLPA